MDDATRQQGGWRTTKIMNRIYTKLSAKEIAEEIHTVAGQASLQLELQRRSTQLGSSRDDILEQPSTTLGPFLAFVAGNFKNIDLDILKDTPVARYVSWITHHERGPTRDLAINLRTRIREHWGAGQRAKRARQS